MRDRWYTTAAAARRLGVTIEEARRLIREGDIPAVLIGGSAGYRVNDSDLETFLKHRDDGHEATAEQPD